VWLQVEHVSGRLLNFHRVFLLFRGGTHHVVYGLLVAGVVDVVVDAVTAADSRWLLSAAACRPLLHLLTFGGMATQAVGG